MKYNLSVGTRACYDSLQGPVPVEVTAINKADPNRTLLNLLVTEKTGAYPKGYIIDDVSIFFVFPKEALTGEYGTSIGPYEWVLKKTVYTVILKHGGKHTIRTVQAGNPDMAKTTAKNSLALAVNVDKDEIDAVFVLEGELSK